MKKIATLIFAAMLAGQAWAYDFKSGDLCYNILSYEEPYIVEVAQSDNYSELTTVTIPEKVTYNEVEYAVAKIGNWAFSDCNNLTSVTIPNSVTSIGDAAFSDCKNLISLTLPNSLTSIGRWAFYDCKGLTSVAIPSSVTSIGQEAFLYVKNIVYSGTAEGSPWGALTVNGVIDGDFVYADAEKKRITAYVGNSGAVTIPNTVTSIGENAFHDCKILTSITIPSSVTSIGNTSNYGAFDGCDSIETLTYNTNAIGSNFSNKKLLKNINIGDAVTSIGGHAFRDCSSLTSIEIPNSVTSIEEEAFNSCNGLTSITIPNSVTSIGNNAFGYCSSLTSVTIPNSVTSIGEYAFDHCENLKSITLPNSITSISNGAFSDCSSLTSITIPNSVTSIGDNAFRSCSSLTSVTIPKSVTSIGEEAFNMNYIDGYYFNLKTVTIPNSVTSIGNNAFRDIKNIVYNGTAEGSPWGALTVNGVVDGDFVYADAEKKQLTAYIGNGSTVTIPNSVTSIGYAAFRGCKNLKMVTIPNSVTSIEGWAFTLVKNIFYSGIADGSPWGAVTVNGVVDGDFVYADAEKKQLTAYVGNGSTATIPNSVTSIGANAFRDCEGLKTIKIPSSVTSVGSEAFGNCSSLQYNEYDNGFYLGNDDNPYVCLIKAKPTDTIMTSCEINSNCKVIYDRAFEDCYYLLSIEIPNSVTSIGFKAFYNCSSLTKVTIPNSVTSIGIMAFIGCSNQLQYNEYDNCCYLGNDDNPYFCLMKTISNDITSCEINNNCKIIYGSGGWDWNYKGGLQSLTSVEIPNSVTSISGCAFYNNSGLTTIEIPNSVTSIGWGVFSGCNNLTIYCEASEKPSGWEDEWNGWRPVYWAGANAVTESVANAVNIYAYSNKIVVENASEDIFVYNAMGALICRDAARHVSTMTTITLKTTGVYIVKTGSTVKRVMVN